ncbi:Frataxin [Canariomyces notabilis]|uniref:ferroxidase n=1 Tax=Canariomyces notabilis TaxID=2074819 RepID=A0AAN6QIW9_9PEZI|nr:Frataxin [Canariomyces arenarius]
MARPSVSKLARVAWRELQTPRAPSIILPRVFVAPVLSPPLRRHPAPAAARRHISSSSDRKGITPDDKPRENVVTPKVPKTPANITDAEYHTIADEYLDRLLSRLEEIQDEREEVDVEYSSGVMTVTFGQDVGTYVINKQPPNKQIWLSSPKSGPKRYDYVIVGEGQNDKQDTATGAWVYLRDGSTLDELLDKELGIDLDSSTNR